MFMFGWFLLFIYGAECGLGSRNTPLRVGFMRQEGRERIWWGYLGWVGFLFHALCLLGHWHFALSSFSLWVVQGGGGREECFKGMGGLQVGNRHGRHVSRNGSIVGSINHRDGLSKSTSSGTTTKDKREWAPDIPPRHSWMNSFAVHSWILFFPLHKTMVFVLPLFFSSFYTRSFLSWSILNPTSFAPSFAPFHSNPSPIVRLSVIWLLGWWNIIFLHQVRLFSFRFLFSWQLLSHLSETCFEGKEKETTEIWRRVGWEVSGVVEMEKR